MTADATPLDHPPSDDARPLPLDRALAIQGRGAGAGDTVRGVVHEGWDVFGIPHGGYLAALGANAVLTVTGRPDLFTITTHYLRKAVVGPMDFTVTTVGGSRRFTTVTATGVQDGQVVLAILASVGDRTSIDGPTWSAAPHEPLAEGSLSPPAGAEGLAFPTPGVAQRMGLRMDTGTIGFASGVRSAQARIRALTADSVGGQLAAVLASDVTPPAVWNALGAEGWVPTVELTVHLRARPAEGPLSVEATTNHVADGFLDEDAVVHDVTGRLVAQSRQLARWSSPG